MTLVQQRIELTRCQFGKAATGTCERLPYELLGQRITFEGNGAQFGFRAAGSALNQGRVLLQQSELDPFWALPGGRVEMLESAEDALRREMREELRLEVEVEGRLWDLKISSLIALCRTAR